MTPSRTVHRVLVAIVASAALVGACTASGGVSPSASPPAGQGTDCPKTEPAPLAAGQTRTVSIATDLGEIAIGLSSDLSPIAVANFVALAECGYYDGVVFHRLVPGFVIQGGDPTGTGTGGPGYTITDEPVTTPYARGTVAMARTAQPNSVGSQFFIVLDDGARAALADANTYQIIGTVTAGMDVVDAIAAMPNSGGATGNMALEPVPMTTVRVTTP